MKEVGIKNWEIQPLVSRMCSKKEIYEVEKKWIGLIGADLNTYSPVMEEKTVQEYKVNYYKFIRRL